MLSLRQELQRKETLLDVIKTTTHNERSMKKSQKDVQQKGHKLHMSEMIQVLKGAYLSEAFLLLS
jgi:GTP cyclohydrolase FolE2